MGTHTKHGKSPASAHKHGAPARLGIRIVTVSDTRDASEDRSGAALREILSAAGHDVRPVEIVKDERRAIAAALRKAEKDADVRAIVFNGGTGVAPRDVTVEAIEPLLDKVLPGFGELFRMLSWEEIGSAAFLSRAIAGTRKGRAVFVLPGSTNAVRLAAERLIAPELPHLIRLLDK